MPTRALAPWASSEGDGEDLDGEGDLVSSLENCTRELNKLCGGLEVQQLEAEYDYTADVDVDTTTLAALEDMSSECAALLACLEDGDHGFGGADDDNRETLKKSVTVANQPKGEREEQQQLQEGYFSEPSSDEKLAEELDIFTEELRNFASCLGDTTSAKEPEVLSLEASSTEECMDDHLNPLDPAMPFIDNGVTCQAVDNEHDRGNENNAAAIAAVDGDCVGNKVAMSTDGANESHHKEVFSQRTKNAITLHVKRLAIQKQRRFGIGNQFRALTTTKDLESDAEEQRVAGVKVVLSKFQSTSVQQHIVRQKFARRRVQQIQEAQRLVESARLRGSVCASQRQSAKSNNGKLQTQAKQNATYLDQFTSTSTHSLPSNEFEPRYLCAVYLYGLRHLGTTYITFSSLAQFEQRARARFTIEDVVNIYREVTETVLPESGRHVRHLKRLRRISSLEHVNDGDTLCITQNAYDDMTILCDWIKRRQRIVHGFQFEVQQAPSNISTFTDEVLPPPKPKPSGNNTTKPQLWDTNGRTIGVKAQHGI